MTNERERVSEKDRVNGAFLVPCLCVFTFSLIKMFDRKNRAGRRRLIVCRFSRVRVVAAAMSSRLRRL